MRKHLESLMLRLLTYALKSVYCDDVPKSSMTSTLCDFKNIIAPCRNT